MSNMMLNGTDEWSGFLSEKSSNFDSGMVELNNQVADTLAKLVNNPSDPQLLARYQAKLSEYTLYRQAQSNIVKSYKDVALAIISNFR